MPVDDALRQPGGAGGVEHPQRVVERNRVERELGRVGGELVPAQGAVEGLAQVGHEDGRAQRVELALQLLDGGPHVVALAAVDVAVDGEQHGGLDLGEPVVDGAGAEVRRARRPDRAEARRGQERHEGLDAVGRQRDDAIALPDPDRDEPGPRPADEITQLAPGDRALEAVFTGEDQREVVVGAVVERVLGVVQRGAGEPLRARHLARAEHGAGLGVEADVEVLDDGRPEAVEIGDRPVVQGGVIADLDTPVFMDPVAEPGERAPVLRVGGPQDVRGIRHPLSMPRRGERQRRWLSNQFRVRCQASAAVSGSSSNRSLLLE